MKKIQTECNLEGFFCRQISGWFCYFVVSFRSLSHEPMAEYPPPFTPPHFCLVFALLFFLLSLSAFGVFLFYAFAYLPF